LFPDSTSLFWHHANLPEQSQIVKHRVVLNNAREFHLFAGRWKTLELAPVCAGERPLGNYRVALGDASFNRDARIRKSRSEGGTLCFPVTLVECLGSSDDSEPSGL
jgi:hypothetical protein